MENLSNEEINKKIDIGLKKKALENKYGALFSENNTLQPDIENEWLENIEQFEEKYQNAEKITVWNYIGQPHFKKFDEINPEKISEELEFLMELLHQHNIQLDTLYEIADEELYRFVTEELFIYEMDNVYVQGMTTCFIYEEFHPNAEHDILCAFDYFFNATMAKNKNIGGDGYDLLYIDIKNYEDFSGKIMDEKEITSKINTFLGFL